MVAGVPIPASPNPFQSELNLTRSCGRARDKTCRRGLDRRGGTRQKNMCNQVGSVEVGAVQKIEKLGAKLQVQAFANSGFLHHREIPGRQPRASVRVALGISEKSAVIWLGDEGFGIEPLIWATENY